MYLESVGIPRSELEQMSGVYGARHTLPTIADKAHAPDDVRNLVGDWQQKADKQATAMADRYSFARCERHCEVREELLTIARKALKRTFADTSSSSCPSWDDVFAHWPPGAEGRCGTIVKYVFTEPETVVAESVVAKQTPQSATSSDGSSESPESSADESGDGLDTLEWQLASSVGGKLHFMSNDCLACGKTLRRAQRGVGLSGHWSLL